MENTERFSVDQRQSHGPVGSANLPSHKVSQGVLALTMVSSSRVNHPVISGNHHTLTEVALNLSHCARPARAWRA